LNRFCGKGNFDVAVAFVGPRGIVVDTDVPPVEVPPVDVFALVPPVAPPEPPFAVVLLRVVDVTPPPPLLPPNVGVLVPPIVVNCPPVLDIPPALVIPPIGSVLPGCVDVSDVQAALVTATTKPIPKILEDFRCMRLLKNDVRGSNRLA
jgi:hypothetical protein